MKAINPATGELLREVPEHRPEEIEERLEQARDGFALWRRTSFEERARHLQEAASVLRGRSGELAELMALEMGKPLAEGRAEVEKCAWACEFYAEKGPALLADEPIATDASRSYVTYRPLGAVLGIMPWNFPFWQVFRFAAPSVMAGNVALVKHAPNVPGCAEALEELFLEAGFPPGVLTNLFVSEEVTGRLILHPVVVAVTLTGSTRAGSAVATLAGTALKKTVLELGGSDPYVVLEDAELDSAVEACATSRLINGGQSCIAAKRFIVVDEIYDAFEARLLERFRGVRMGSPFDPDTELGPMAREDLRATLHEQVEKSVALGARLLLGGTCPDGPGFFYPPTVLAGVKPGMPAYDEEVFGPVAVLVRADHEADALRIANDTSYGLGAAVFTADRKRGERIAREELNAGSAFVNAFVRSDPRLPFGGIGRSGHGRELAREGIREFVNVKTVYLA